MKLNEFLAEDQLDEIFGAAARTIGRLAVPFEKTKNLKDLAPSVASGKAAMRAAASSNKSLLKIPVFGKILYRSRIKNAQREFELAKSTVAAAAINNLGATMSNVIVAFNLYDSVTDYYAAATVIEKSDLSEEEKRQKITELRGVLFTQVIAGGLIAKSAQLGRIVTGILPAMAKIVPGTVIPKIGIAAKEVINAAIRVGAGALTIQLTTDQGIKALTDWLGETVVNGFGAGMNMFMDFLAWSWSWLKAGVKYATGYRAGQGGAQDKEQDASSSAQTDKNKDKTDAGLGGFAGAIAQGGSLQDMANRILAKQLGVG